MGDSNHRLGPHLGRILAWRDRGAIYTEGLRTSLQAAAMAIFVGAGGQQLLQSRTAVLVGIGIFVGLEALKIAIGCLDYRLGIFQNQNRIQAEASPIVMRQLEAIERLGARRE